MAPPCSSNQRENIEIMSEFSPTRVEKPWGYELIWAHTDRYVGKILHIRAGHKLSWQYHEIKDETIYVLAGELDFETETDQELRRTLRMNPGEAFRVEPFRKHRMIAVTDCDLLEASTPELLDVVRLEDAYGRQGTHQP